MSAMKSVLTILLSVFSFFAKGQSINNENCNIIIAALSSKTTQKIFHFDKRKNIPIVIIDTSSYFSECLLPKIYDRDLVISKDYSLLNPSQLKDTTPSYILIHGFYKKGTKYGFKFFYKWTGALGIIELRKKGKQLLVSKSSINGYH
jgi:hypothetical protein